MKRAVWLIVAVVLLVLLILFSQKSSDRSSSTQETTTKGRVVTTIYPLYYITKSIAGKDIEVDRLIKPGSEIHSFSPTPAQMVRLDQSDLLITLGRELEPWVQKLSQATTTKVLSLEYSLDLIHIEQDHHEHEEDEHHHGNIDPHVWLDFDNDIKMTKMIRDALAEHYPQYSASFHKNASILIEQLKRLKVAYSESLMGCQKHTILVGHNAFGYMQRRYGFEAQGIMGIFAHSRPNAMKITKLADTIKLEGLKYIFSDPIESNKNTKQLATDMNLTIEPLYALGNISLADQKRGEDMITLLYLDLVQLKKALVCP